VHQPVGPCLPADGEKMTFSKITNFTILNQHLLQQLVAGNLKFMFSEAAVKPVQSESAVSESEGNLQLFGE